MYKLESYSHGIILSERQHGPQFISQVGLHNNELNDILLFGLPNGGFKGYKFKITKIKDNNILSITKNTQEGYLSGILKLSSISQSLNVIKLFQLLLDLLYQYEMSSSKNLDKHNFPLSDSAYEKLDTNLIYKLYMDLTLKGKIIFIGSPMLVISFLTTFFNNIPYAEFDWIDLEVPFDSFSKEVNIMGFQQEIDIPPKIRRKSSVYNLLKIRAELYNIQ